MRFPSKPGRKRAYNPAIPAHIDQRKIPATCYWNPTGLGRWYIQTKDENGKLRNKRIAGPDATLADLYRIIEEWHGINRNTLRWLSAEFEQSLQFVKLSASSQKDYRYCRSVVCEFPSKQGMPLGDAQLSKWSSATTQKLIDKLASQGTPSKANHVLRYLRRLFRWGKARGHIQSIPSEAVEQAKERKKRRLPSQNTYEVVLRHAYECGQLQPHTTGSCPSYIWIIMELAYLCRLRGIEVLTLTDENETPEGLLTNRRKGSRDNVVAWTPRLRKAWQAAKALRDTNRKRWNLPTPMEPAQRWIFLGEDGKHLGKSSFDSAWNRFIRNIIAKGIITEAERFAPHDLKRKGITDTPGTRADKQHASGHKNQAMLDIYDQSVPVVRPAVED